MSFRWSYFILAAVFLTTNLTGLPSWAQNRPKRVLVVVAHPDDETMAAGMLIRMREKGIEIQGIYATLGEEGRVFGKRLSREETAKIRRQELVTATNVLGFSKTLVLDAPDIALRDPITNIPSRDAGLILRDHWDIRKINDQIQNFAERFQPDVVITMSLSNDSHSGHKAIRLITQNLFQQKRLGPNAKSLYSIDEGDRVRGSHERGLETLSFSLDTVSEIASRSYAHVVHEIENLHASQFAIDRPLRMASESIVLVNGSPDKDLTSLFGKRYCKGLISQ